MTDREKAIAYFRHREAQIPMPGARAMYQEAIKALEQPEVIRCKDCRYAKMTHTGECKYCTYLADNFGIDDAVYFEGNDYCSHAERRTDGSD